MRKRQVSDTEARVDAELDENRAVAGSEPVEEISVLGCDGMLPLPPHITRAAGLREGSIIFATITDDGILLRGGRPSDSKQRWSRARKRLVKIQDESRQP